MHAQRDFEQHIEHDQHVQIGHERHESVGANSYAEFKAEEHHTVHQDRRCEVKGDDHLTVGRSQQVKAGVGYLVEAGQEIHFYAGKKIVIEAGAELTIKVGGHFIKLDGNGISRVGPDAAGIAGTAARVAVLTALKPAAEGQAGTTHHMHGSSSQEAHDEQMQLLSRSGTPLKGIKVTVAVPGETAPQVVTSDADGLLPRIKTQTAQDLKAFLSWDKFHVPEGADSYERSRKQ